MDYSPNQNRYSFPEKDQKRMIREFLKIEEKMEQQGDNTFRVNFLNKRKKDLEGKLFEIFHSLQTVIIGKRVMYNKYVPQKNPNILINDDKDIFDDLVLHQIQQMFQFFEKIDLDRKLYSILSSIQNYSQRIHYFTFYQKKHYIVVDDTIDDEESDFESKFDILTFETSKYISEDNIQSLTEQQIEEYIEEKFKTKKEITIDNTYTNEYWVDNFYIFDLIDNVLKFGFCKDFKGIYLKLYIINLLFYEQIRKFNKNIYLFVEFLDKKRRYNRKQFNMKNGLSKIVKLIIDEYTNDNPSIMMGDKQIKLYSILLLYIMLIKKQIPQCNFSVDELESMQNMKHQLSDITELLVSKEKEYDVDFNNLILNCRFEVTRNSKTEIRLEMIIDGQEEKGSN